jgi:flagellar basal-body rod protein FlgG
MYKGIYIAASGAMLKQTQLEVISQNIANANTTGYKKDAVSFKDYLVQAGPGAEPDGRVMSDYSASKTDLSNGTIVRTGNSLDIALEGDGLIALEGDRYTRRGDLKKSSDGYLTTHDGTKVLGSNGPILLPPDGAQISIDSEGKISVDGVEIDTIKVLDFGGETPVAKSGESNFIAGGTGEKAAAGVRQGYLEMSNVNAVKEMVRMIETMREFESYQKAIQAFDEATGKVNNELGRL